METKMPEQKPGPNPAARAPDAAERDKHQLEQYAATIDYFKQVILSLQQLVPIDHRARPMIDEAAGVIQRGDGVRPDEAQRLQQLTQELIGNEDEDRTPPLREGVAEGTAKGAQERAAATRSQMATRPTPPAARKPVDEV